MIFIDYINNPNGNLEYCNDYCTTNTYCYPSNQCEKQEDKNSLWTGAGGGSYNTISGGVNFLNSVINVINSKFFIRDNET